MLSVITTQKEFREKIERLVKNEGMTYLDAVVHCCETMAIEFDTAAKLLNKQEKETIKAEATKLHLMKKEHAPEDETPGTGAGGCEIDPKDAG